MGGPHPQSYVLNPTYWSDPLGLAPYSLKRVKSELGRMGMSVSHYDIEHVPHIPDPNGLPAFGRTSIVGDQLVTGRRGRPLIQISDMGLSSRENAIQTIFHEEFHVKSFQRHGHLGSEADAELHGARMLEEFERRLKRHAGR
jgi:hypothetical protein